MKLFTQQERTGQTQKRGGDYLGQGRGQHIFIQLCGHANKNVVSLPMEQTCAKIRVFSIFNTLYCLLRKVEAHIVKTTNKLLGNTAAEKKEETQILITQNKSKPN